MLEGGAEAVGTGGPAHAYRASAFQKRTGKRGESMTDPVTRHDAVVVGAGPAGLTAGLYLGRYRRDVLIVHDGTSRALRIPRTHNAPGFPDGIEGLDLIDRMMRHVTDYGAEVEQAEITAIEWLADGFRLIAADGRAWECRAVVLASEIILNQVDLPHDAHEAAIRVGVLRYCPICDGYEHRDRRIGVIGCDSDGAAEALFLRQYPADITLMPLSHPELSKAQAAELAEAGIVVETGALSALEPGDDRMHVRLAGRESLLSFDVVYPALGTRPRTGLAVQLGVSLNKEGSIPVRAIEDSGIPGFFAAGDVVEGLDQISVAMGHGAMVATHAHNWLREQDQHSLQAKA
jgi:thioredoxin reductase (NADPH)